MRWFPRLRLWLRALVRRPAVETELDEELRFHVEMEAAKNQRAGMSPEEARRAALVAFGGVERHKEAVRDGRGVRWLEELAGDVRYTLRGARQRPALATLVVALLALGIGANAAIFGVVDRLLLTPPAGVRDPGQVGVFYFQQTFSWAGLVTQSSSSYPQFTLLRDQSRTLDGVAAYTVGRVSLGRGASAQQVVRGAASADFFRVLGVPARLGRLFTGAEDRPPVGVPVVVLSDDFWRGHFGGDPGVLGRVVRLGASSFTVIGVLPRGFSGLDLGSVDVWTPLSASASEVMADGWERSWGSLWLTTIARLRPGASAAAAQAEATGLFRRALAQQEAEDRAGSAGDHLAVNGTAGAAPPADPTARALFASILPGRAPAGARADGDMVRVSVWLAGVALLVLLIACANVASLLLARALARRKEIAVRLALGVSRGRLVRQVMAETLVLAVLGGDAGLLFALVGGRVLRALLLPGVNWQGTPLSGHVLALTAALIVASAFLAGLAPALQSWRVQVGDALRSGMRGGSERRSGLRGGLVIAQAALTVLLLVGAGLFVRSLRNLQSIPRGFEPARVLLVEPGLARYGYPAHEVERLTGVARERLAHVPGVQAVALTTSTPFRNSMSVTLKAPGIDSIPVLKDGGPYITAVSPEYFRVMGTRIVAGRGFNDGDRLGGPRVAVVNATMAHMLWPRESPLGRCLQVGGRDAPCTEIVGVAENALRQSVDFTPVMQYYVPLAQGAAIALDGDPWSPTPSLLVRTAGPAEAAVGRVRREVQGIAPDVPYADVRPLEALIDPRLRPWRLGATMFTLFGVLALLVAGIGLYGVIAYDVAQRAPEVAIRMAMGASALRVVRGVVRDALRLALAGLVLGGLGALLVAPATAPLLFHESPRDPVVFATVAGLLLLVGAAAALVPARRASRVQPASALRAE